MICIEEKIEERQEDPERYIIGAQSFLEEAFMPENLTVHIEDHSRNSHVLAASQSFIDDLEEVDLNQPRSTCTKRGSIYADSMFRT